MHYTGHRSSVGLPSPSVRESQLFSAGLLTLSETAALLDSARLGLARLSLARLGLLGSAQLGSARQDSAGPGSIQLGSVLPGPALYTVRHAVTDAGI